jgi:hypothetical protein
MAPEQEKAIVNWRQYIFAIPLLASLFAWGFNQYLAFRDLRTQLAEQARKIERLEGVVRDDKVMLMKWDQLLRLYPPHKHFGHVTDIPTALPMERPPSALEDRRMDKSLQQMVMPPGYDSTGQKIIAKPWKPKS